MTDELANPSPTNILLIGSGGREHALAWKIAQSPLVGDLWVAGGNAGIDRIAHNAGLDASDHEGVIAFCQMNEIGLVVVGPEVPLVAGLVDDLTANNILAFGPTRAAAQLEGSKAFTKRLCDRMQIPTAGYGHFEDVASARAHVTEQGAPIVVKADGLAAGKGVTVAMTLDEALAAIDDCFSAEGAQVVIEEFLEGEEVSLFCVCDGHVARPLTTAQDHKRVGDGDTGPNTGGMGAYSPAANMSHGQYEDAIKHIIEPTMRGMAEAGTHFAGVLYAGLILTRDGPKLIEYNCRFGDPECQTLMVRMQSDIVPLLMAAANGDVMAAPDIEWSDDAALTVVMASKGYPGAYEKATQINHIPADSDDLVVFHAGTAQHDDTLLAIGGRVLNVTAAAPSIAEAQRRAYAAVDAVDWDEGFCRRDIGWRAI
ncbi:MAG: phosphoribosylamine--glycine ligase [Pseudomonadota bacterium]